MATCSKYIPPGVDSEGVYMWKAVEGIIEKYDLYQIVLQIVSNWPILSSSLIIQYILSQDYHPIKYAIFNFHNTIYLIDYNSTTAVQSFLNINIGAMNWRIMMYATTIDTTATSYCLGI